MMKPKYKKGVLHGLLFSFIAVLLIISTNYVLIHRRPFLAASEHFITYILLASFILFVFVGFLYDIGKSFPKLRCLLHKNKIILLAILVLALRLYMIDRTFTGYHSWKEVHYAIEARHFMERGDFFTPEWDYVSSFDDIGYHADALPITSWFVYIMWKIFGEVEWAARLPIILFSVLTVLTIFLIGKELFNKNIGYWAAFLFAITPLSVYFGQNVQPDPIMVFFMTLTVYFQIMWVRGNNKYLLFSALSGVLAILSKYPAAVVIILTMAGVSIWRFNIKLNIKSYLNLKMWFIFILWSIAVCFPGALWYIFAKKYGESVAKEFLLNTETLINPLFYEQVIGRFIILITPLVALIIFVGIISMLYSIQHDKKAEKNFLIIFFLSTVLIQVITSTGAYHHSYYQLPILIPAVIFAGFFIDRITSNLFHVFLVVLLLLTTTLPFTLSMFEEDLDIYRAGIYINKHTHENEKILYMARPMFLFYADRKGVAMNENNFEKALERSDVNYLIIARELDYFSNKWINPMAKLTYIQNNTVLEKEIGRFSMFIISKEE